MENRLYIGNLSWGTTQEKLEEEFAKAGTVNSAAIIMDRDSNPPRSKGFGFVEMATEAEAQAAIAMWHDKELDGKVLKVNIAKPREER